MSPAGNPQALFCFATPASTDGWFAIDDGVMGGLSRSRMQHHPAGHAIFSGVVSLERNSGFASVRAPLPHEVAAQDAAGYLVEACGDGHRYRLNLRMAESFDGINYQAEFAPPVGDWSVIRLPVAAFLPTWRGKPVPDAPPLDPASVKQVGLMIADRQAGPFALSIRRISAG
mgnify:FL=1